MSDRQHLNIHRLGRLILNELLLLYYSAALLRAIGSRIPVISELRPILLWYESSLLILTIHLSILDDILWTFTKPTALRTLIT